MTNIFCWEETIILFRVHLVNNPQSTRSKVVKKNSISVNNTQGYDIGGSRKVAERPFILGCAYYL